MRKRGEQLVTHGARQVRAEYARRDETQHVDGNPIVEALARLIDERQLGQRLQPRIRRHFARNAHSEPAKQGGAERRGREESVREPQAVHHQVFDGDRPRSGHGVVERAVGPAQHAHCTELRRPARDGIVQPELAFIQQPQREGDGDGLRHRGETEDRAAIQGNLALHVEPAGRRVGDEFASVPHLRHDAGDVAGVDCGARGLLH